MPRDTSRFAAPETKGLTPQTDNQQSDVAPKHRFSVAPMMDRTDRHFRYMFRSISKKALLYTEMVAIQALLHGDRDRLLAYNVREHPLALQLGGDDPTSLAFCARLAEERGFDEINLNVGCPSDRVRKGNFGACLMAQPERVAACVKAMVAAVRIPITVKHRIGIDDNNSYAFMRNFVSKVSEAGCQRFTVHARIAILGGLNPKQNRSIPPLRYEDVYRLKEEHKHLNIELNGGITDLQACSAHLKRVDSVMVGRAAFDTPMAWAGVDRDLYGGSSPPTSALKVAEEMLSYASSQVGNNDCSLHHIIRPMLGLFAHRPGARSWRRILSEGCIKGRSGIPLLENAIALMRDSQAAKASNRKNL